MRIRSSLILFGIALLLPTIIGTALGVGYIYNEQQGAYRASILERSRAMALVMDREFARRETLMKTLSGSPLLANGEFERFHNGVRNLLAPGKSGIFLQRVSGETIFDTRSIFGAADLPAQTELNRMRRNAGPDGLLVSNLFVSPVTGEYSFAVQVPVRHEGRVAYYLSLSSPAAEIQPLFGGNQLPDGWFGAILDREVVIVARTEESEKWRGKRAPEKGVKFVKENHEGYYDVVTLHGIPITSFVSRAPNSGWTFMTGVPRSLLNQTAVRATMIVGGIAAMMLGLALALALIIGRRIARPIENLRTATTNLREGIPLTAYRSGIMEIDAVNDEMVRTSQEIRDTRADLENRIADAVATAEHSQRALLQAQKLEALGRLTGGIAHDFNNVLQTLMTGLQLSYLRSVEPGIKKSLETCQRAVDRAAELVRQLMAFGRVQDVHLATVDLSKKLHDITPMLKGALRGDIHLELELADELWPVTIDPLQFELALLNLCINARDAMPDGGVVKIAIRNRSLKQPVDELAPGDFVEVSVADSGKGMSEEVLARAVEPFFTTKSVGKGSGLGLPQAYGFVKQAGGALTLHSKIHEGTTITLYLPRANAPLTENDGNTGGTEKLRSLKGRILLVDDERQVLDVVGPALEAAGLEVRVVSSGDDALTLLNENEVFDVVFSDIVMPGQINGIELAERIREQFPKTRVVLATGYSERRVAIPGVRILAKPYDIREAINALRTELDVLH